MPLQVIEARRLYEHIAEQIANLIRTKELKPGDRLPPERLLARQLGVSRPSVREAMIALEVAGLVEVRTGAGTYVRAVPGVAFMFYGPDARDTGPGPFELTQARKLVEGEVVAQAAREITAERLDRLHEAIELMERENLEGKMSEEGDRLFHVRIAESTRNSVLMAIVEILWDRMRGPLWQQVNQLGLAPLYRVQWVEDHKEILESLRLKDSRRARRAMHRHLTNVQRILLSA